MSAVLEALLFLMNAQKTSSESRGAGRAPRTARDCPAPAPARGACAATPRQLRPPRCAHQTRRSMHNSHGPPELPSAASARAPPEGPLRPTRCRRESGAVPAGNTAEGSSGPPYDLWDLHSGDDAKIPTTDLSEQVSLGSGVKSAVAVLAADDTHRPTIRCAVYREL
jgi:hypothetical protein